MIIITIVIGCACERGKVCGGIDRRSDQERKGY
jgi:hypothetical protein